MLSRVLIAGAGIGGLCLAQGLRKSGIEVAVFERDPSVWFRSQGYRFRIDRHGDEALARCLPADLYEFYQSTSNMPSRPPVGAFDEQLNLIYQFPGGPSQSPSHTAVDRQTLRQVLLAGLGDSVHFGKRVLGTRETDQGPELILEGENSVQGDLVVAADGWNSTLRRQVLPNATVCRLGMNCICGKIPMDEALFSSLPDRLLSGFTPILGPNRRTLGLAPFHSRGSSSAIQVAADYLMWILVYPEEEDGVGGSIVDQTFRLTSGWNEEILRLLRLTDLSSLFQIPLTCSRPVEPWTSSRTTFLGDAIHAMTPAGGIGANTAMRDAALLTDLLVEVQMQEIDMNQAITSYESQMRAYGFAAVAESLNSASHLYRFTQGAA